jgi:acyl-coenzyme A synthetase/AMP-(fatty) acid ligase/acyl carrier protein
MPKGVLGSYKGLSHFLNWQRDAFGIGPNDRVAQLTSLSFDPLLRDVFLPLTSGGTLCIPEEGDQQEPLAWLARERVTVVHTVPTLLQSWLAQQQGGADLHALRWLFVAGEALSGALVQAWRDRIPGGAEMVNLYGPTETTLVKCFHRVAGEIEPGLQPVGVPLPQTQALVLNAAGQPCGIGELGEVVLRTPFRTLGYINSPQEMHTHFLPNPFRDDADDLLYFTGDRGLYRVDGVLDLLGRLDDQLKIRGVRVEPGEVAAVLAEHPAVGACVVIGRKDALGGDALVAFVVSASDQRITVGELRTFLGARLPAALVPSEWQFLDALPQLPNGKVDRSALPVPAGAGSGPDVAYVAPGTPIESRLAAIWREVLGVAQVGIHDNFFAVGGHSLMVMQLISRIHREFGVTLPLRQIFEASTIAALAAIIERVPQDADNIALARTLAAGGPLAEPDPT